MMFAYQEVTDLTLNLTALALTVGESAQLTATVAPEDATDKTVTWTSSDPDVATVDENGVVTAHAAGTAMITAAAGGVTASCTVTVSTPYIPPADPSYRITIGDTANGTVTAPASAKAGSTVTLTAAPNTGYELASLTVTDWQGSPVAVWANPNGTYSFTMPGSQVTVSASFVPVSLPFTDVARGAWYYDAVHYVWASGLMNGVGGSLFDPGGTTTRGMLMTILARLDGVDTAGSAPWYQAGMEWAVASGVSDGTNPEGAITREQAAAMLYRCAGSPAVAEDHLNSFADGDSVSGWARDAVNWAVSAGILEGSGGSLNPQGTATRAQLAAMLMRFCENVL